MMTALEVAHYDLELSGGKKFVGVIHDLEKGEDIWRVKMDDGEIVEMPAGGNTRIPPSEAFTIWNFLEQS